MRLALVLGTRPEIIKMTPVIRACRAETIPFLLIHTGQHYSHELDRVFFDQLGLPEPDFRLNVGSGRHGEQTAKMLAPLENIFFAEKPDFVLVEGDTNSVLAGALAAVKLHIKVGHVEAGLRSYDRSMPEEINRVLVDHMSDVLFAPTEAARLLLRKENIPDSLIYVTGNTIVDAVLQNRDLALENSAILRQLDLRPKAFVLMTAHRQENVDVPERLAGIIRGAALIARDLGLPILYPIHPRSRKMLDRFGVATEGIRLVDPVDFLDFLALEASARLILTDSGGVQEEACILGVPCVTLRDNTERPETIDVGANVLAGAAPDVILGSARAQLQPRPVWSQPFGDGHAAPRMLRILRGLACASS
ncbi:MAG: UDP-N-acetylglucosamine 2-epimerase (non-hydrolyzing) [Gemmataceae bacterium]